MPELFQFELTADIERRNDELLALYKKYSKVNFGGIVLAVKTIRPRGVTTKIDNRSWLRHVDIGIKERESTTYRDNADGTSSTLTTTVTSNGDGSVTTETVERITRAQAKDLTQTETLSVPLVDPSTAGLGRTNSPWTEKLEKKVTTLVKQDLSNNTSIVTVKTEVDPENPNDTYEYTETFTDEQYKVEQAKPVIMRSITGKEFIQRIQPAPPQGQADFFWNDDMPVTKSEKLTSVLDNDDGTTTTTTTTREVDARGYTKEIIQAVTAETPTEQDNNTVVTKTVSNPAEEVVTETIYDRDSVEKSKKTTTTKKYDDVTGEASLSITETTEVITDELGKEITKTSRSVFNPMTGVEDTEEVEEITNIGADRISYERSIEKNFETGVQSTTETVTTVDGLGVSSTESRTSRSAVSNSEAVRTYQRVYEDKDDAIVDDIVNGYLITEYEISGELMSQNQVEAIQSKYFRHQSAWAMLNIREEQLALGDRISPDKRRQLYKEWQELFYGVPGKKVSGGETLDRIGLYAFGEQDVPVVFAPSKDSFSFNWIDGSMGLYSWSMTLQKYERIVRDKSNTFQQETAGGLYGRSDNEHWKTGNVGDLSSEISDRKDIDEGGEWSYV